jgi:hypothetical protein
MGGTVDDIQELTVNGKVSAQLRAARGWVRLRDPDGNILGNFKPPDVPPYDPAILPPPMSLEEMRRRGNEGGRPLADILADLEKMA